MLRAKILIIFLFYFLFPSGIFAQNINEILTKMQEANSLIRYKGILTTIIINTPFAKVYRYKIINDGNLYRKEEFLTDGVNKEVNLDDGKYLWRFFPNKNLVIKETSKKIQLLNCSIQEKLELVKKNYIINLVGEYTTNNRKGYKILFKPKKTDRPQQVFWIDTETGIPIKIEKYGPNQDIVSVSSFSEINFNFPLKNDHFLMVPSKTSLAEVKEDSNLSFSKAKILMGSEIFTPNYLPSGFKLNNIIFRTSGNEKTLQFFYTDGLNSLSIFEKPFKPEEKTIKTPFGNVHFRGQEAFFHTSGTMNIINIKSEPTSTTLMSEVFKDELVKVAESLNPEGLKSPLHHLKNSPKK